ncbi:MAG: hypothetical protein Kow00121_39730 [Elainellaceae cyanobacterium]
MELNTKRVLEILRDKGVKNLFHANTVQTSCTFLQNGYLMARGVVAERGLNQTPQKSDGIDKRCGIWFDLFLDSTNIHYRAKHENYYGPVLFVFKLEILEQDWLPSLWITKSNPQNWTDDTTTRYFLSEDDFEHKYKHGDFDKMLLLRHCGGVLKLAPYLEEIYLDNPHLEIDGVDIYSQALGALKASARISNMQDIIISPHPCKNSCACNQNYERMNDTKLSKFFIP